MAKALRCRDVGANCDFEARGETVEDVIKQTTAHAKAVHGFEQITPEMEDTMRGAIRDVGKASARGAQA